MLKKLMITTAIAGLMIGSAFAEGTPPSPPAATPPAAIQPAPAHGSKSTRLSKSGSAVGQRPLRRPSSAKFVNSQRQDQFLASKFKGTDVVGADDKKIGDVSDILFDKDGKIEAYVVGVGGFLGIGAKDVALAPSAFQVVAGRQVQERVRQAAALDDQGRAEAGCELRAVQGAELDHRHGRPLTSVRWAAARQPAPAPVRRGSEYVASVVARPRSSGNSSPGPTHFWSRRILGRRMLGLTRLSCTLPSRGQFAKIAAIGSVNSLGLTSAHVAIPTRFQRRRARRAVAQFRRAHRPGPRPT